MQDKGVAKASGNTHTAESNSPADMTAKNDMPTNMGEWMKALNSKPLHNCASF
jgi:hypothetical protein